MNKSLQKKSDTPEWRIELQKMMATWHFSIMKIEQFIIKTIEEENKKQ